MAATRKFQITAFKSDSTNYSVTIANPKNGITEQEVRDYLSKYDELYGDDTTLKTARYIDTSDTFVYPVS